MTKDSAKFLRVTDSSCTAESPERTHDVFVRGTLTRTIFTLGKEVILPFEHAIKFMIDGFTVEEVDGRTLNLPAVTKESIRSELAADQVIAYLSELTLASLKLRAGQKQGGEIFLDADDSARGDLIDFILGKPPGSAADEPLKTVDGEDDLVDDEGDEDDITPPKKPVGDNQPTVPAGKGPVTTPFTDDKNPPAPAKAVQAKPERVSATSGAQELAATVADPYNTFETLKPADGKIITADDVQAHIDANGLLPHVVPGTEGADTTVGNGDAGTDTKSGVAAEDTAPKTANTAPDAAGADTTAGTTLEYKAAD